MKTKLAVTIALLIAVCGCTTINPDTGEKEHDPVKTEKVQAIFKPIIAGTVTSILEKHPEHKPIIEKIATGVCALSETNTLSPSSLRLVINEALQTETRGLDPLLIGGINAIIATFELYYADRLNADIPAGPYVQHISKTLCDGILQGLMFNPDA